VASLGDWSEHYADLKQRLFELRPLVRENQKTLEYFDELVEANEFEVALHALCDSVLKGNTPAPATGEIDRIEALHERMELKDNCVERLKAKTAISDIQEA
jgi:hypothetical protein